MGIKNYFLNFLAFFFIAGMAMAQDAQQRVNTTRQYNLKHMRVMASHYRNFYETAQENARAYARANNLPVVIKYDDGRKSYLMRMDNHGNLIYRTGYNVKAGITIGTNSLYPGGGLGLQLTGQGMVVGEWDEAKARETHVLLAGKVSFKDATQDYSDHSTHVAGTLVGKKLTVGPGVTAKGMAYGAKLDDYNWDSDLPEMTQAAANGLLVSNHSYGIDLEQVNDPLDFFGKYLSYSQSVDQIAYNAPYYTIVASAGNSRDQASEYNPNDGGYNLLAAEFATAKNDIVVAAVKPVTNYTGPNSVAMSTFSSWGPTLDGRVKPDISADGVKVWSSVAFDANGNPSDSTYAYYWGTSMASPTVAGSILLLQQLSANLNGGQFLRSSTIKAIIVETAREAGNNPGPDAAFGWGLLNVKAAAQLMIDNHNKSGSFYDELKLDKQNKSYTKTVTATGNQDLKVTIAWTDPPADPSLLSSDSDPVLINDLDLRITDSHGNVYKPWRLNPQVYSAAASKGDNAVDNVEQVVIANPVAGEKYTIKVTHKALFLTNFKQEFGMAVLGSKALAVDSHKLTGFSMYPNPATDQVNLNLRKTGNQVHVMVYDIMGRRVLTKDYEGFSGFQQSINVANLTSGIYFVKITTDGKQATKKLIVQ